jgi:hypothetical protein
MSRQSAVTPNSSAMHSIVAEGATGTVMMPVMGSLKLAGAVAGGVGWEMRESYRSRFAGGIAGGGAGGARRTQC